MMPSFSSSSATVAVDKATSDLLIGPDWTMNIDICDSINSNQWQAKDVVKAVKKRLQHKNPKVQLLALTLLETMVKNCGDFVHFQIADRQILDEMVKIMRKKADMQVRDKILVLLDSWQEAFGGAGGKHPQYFWAYEDLRRSGVQFPPRSLDAAPIFTPPASHPNLGLIRTGYGMPSSSSRTLDETMATEIESLSLSGLDAMWNVMELLDDMLQAVNPDDREAVTDEVIVELVNRCRSNQKKLMQMLTTTGDEELLARGLELNDSLQTLLAKHDAIASGSPPPIQGTNRSPKQSEASTSNKQTDMEKSSPRSEVHSPAPPVAIKRSQIDEDEEEEDDFAQLARRHSKTQPMPSQSAPAGGCEGIAPSDGNSTMTSVAGVPSPVPCNALALPDPPAPVRTTKELDMIELLSITLSTTSPSPHTPHTPSSSYQNVHQIPVSPPGTQGYPYTPQSHPVSPGQQPFNNYVVPWAQPQQQSQSQSQIQPRLQSQNHMQTDSQSQFQFQAPYQTQVKPQSVSQSQLQAQSSTQFQPSPRLQPHPQPLYQPQPSPLPPPEQQQTQLQPQYQPQIQQQYQQYPPPPWAPTPGYLNSQNHISATNNMSNPRVNTAASPTPAQAAKPLQHLNSFPLRGTNGSTMIGDPWGSPVSRNTAPSVGQKPFIPSYRLFEDLNVFGNADGKLKVTNNAPSLSGSSSQGLVGGRK